MDDFWNAELKRAPRPLVPAVMVVDALLDARSVAGNEQALDAIDELLSRISHRQRLTPDEAIVVVFQLNAAERQFGTVASAERKLRRRVSATAS
ncbi:MAG: hypothetical protein ACXWBN_06330 [Acidimicrobiales bacterium]